MLDTLATSPKMVGLKQSRKAVKDGLALYAFLAQDAELKVKQPFEALCRECNVTIHACESCEELGRACGIEVGAAVAVVLRNQ